MGKSSSSEDEIIKLLNYHEKVGKKRKKLLKHPISKKRKT